MQDPQLELELRQDATERAALFDIACGHYFQAIKQNHSHDITDIRRQARFTGGQCQTAIDALLYFLNSSDGVDRNEIQHVGMMRDILICKLEYIPE
jgi:hypothetical protein